MVVHHEPGTPGRPTTRSRATWLPSAASCVPPTKNGEQGPYGYYQIRRRSDGLAIGGVGFKGPPDGGVVEVGYGLVPSARGQGYAAEALEILVQIAAGLGVTTIRAETDPDNGASRRTLEHAGFHRVDADPGPCRYERRTSRHGVGAGQLGQGPALDDPSGCHPDDVAR